MAIDDSGEWWTGSEPADLEPYLTEYSRSNAAAYPTNAFRLVRCKCGSERFHLARAGTMTQRTCIGCGQVRYVSRFGKAIHWEEAAAEETPELYRCVACDGNEANIGVGFAGYPQNPELDAILWFYVGARCARCGVLDCFNGGKVGYGPAGTKVFKDITGEIGN